MIDFLRKFLGYFDYDDPNGALLPYEDGLGQGTFSDIRHFIWMISITILCILLYRVFKKHPKQGKKISTILVSMMFIIRLINQIVRAIIGAEIPAWRAFPFHMCTIMSFLLPIVVIFNLKNLKTSVYTLSLMGGIITILMGNYFEHQFLTFPIVEGMWTHSILVLIPIIEIATGNYRFEIKKSWSVFMGIGILLIWSTLANEVFFKDYDPNYMYLKENGLPNNLGGEYYFLIYASVFLIFYSIIYGIPILYRHLIKN